MHYSGYAYDAAASSDSGRFYILPRPRHAAAGPPTLLLLGAHANAMSEIYKFSRGTQVMVVVAKEIRKNDGFLFIEPPTTLSTASSNLKTTMKALALLPSTPAVIQGSLQKLYEEDPATEAPTACQSVNKGI